MGYRNRYRDYEDETCDGVRDGCEGCSLCVKEVRTSSVHIARKTRKNIVVGDKIEVVKGFDYQEGGPRTGYVSYTRILGLGPNRPPVLVGKGWVNPPFALPYDALKREELRARWASLSTKVWETRGVEALQDLLEEAHILIEEVTGFLAEHEDFSKLLQEYIAPYGMKDLTKRIEERLEGARKAEERERLKKEWEATGFRTHRDAGFRVIWQGQEYILTAEWTKWVAHSNLEYMGESVDGSVVWGRELLNPETGKVALRWQNGWDCPRA